MAKKFIDVFQRYEKKYIIDSYQYEEIRRRTADRFSPDEYGKSTIMNLYLDTPEFLLIRRSLDKPLYKEKLRLRTYGIPTNDSNAFVEIKKKYRGIVYKRRVRMSYEQAEAYLLEGKSPDMELNIPQTQILHELDWLIGYYRDIAPVMVISYDRTAFFGYEDPGLRITYDGEIRWRTDDLDLRHGVYGKELLREGLYLMEIKIPGVMPMWLSQILDQLQIWPITFSKYGMAHLKNNGIYDRYPKAYPYLCENGPDTSGILVPPAVALGELVV